jgi:hypothetical protein
VVGGHEFDLIVDIKALSLCTHHDAVLVITILSHRQTHYL